MSSSDHLDEDTVGLLSLGLLDEGDPARRGAEAHADACPRCARALQELRAAAALLDGLPPLPGPSAPALQRAKASVLAEPDWPTAPLEQASPLAVRQAVAVFTAFAILALIAKHRSHDGRVWLEAGAALAVAVLSPLAAYRRSLVSLGMIVLASSLLVAAAATTSSLSPLVGLKCVVIELLAASLPLGLAVQQGRRLRAAPNATTFASFAAAGALAGQAALDLTCPDRSGAPHLVLFHLAGVLLAALLGASVGWSIRRRVTAPR